MRKAIVGTNYLCYKVIYQSHKGNWEIVFFTDQETAEAFCRMVSGKMLKQTWHVNSYMALDDFRLME